MSTFNKHKLSLLAVAISGLGAMGSVQAATLSCGPTATPLRIATTDKAQWSTDARNSPTDTPAAVVDSFISNYYSWFNPATIAQPIAAKWLSFGTVNEGAHPLVNSKGDRAKGAWLTNHATFIYNEPITIGTDVDLASIKIKGRGGADNIAKFSVMPAKLPGGVNNPASPFNPADPTTFPWVTGTDFLPGSWLAPVTINLDGSANGLGFYYGDNAIGLSFYSEALNQQTPGGVVADFEVTADCLTPAPAQPTAPLSCPVGNKKGDLVKIGPFTTNARDWKWTWRTNTAGNALENVEQPLFDDYRWRGYFSPAALPTLTPPQVATAARWISPGTTDPFTTDIPGVPYPAASGQSKGGVDGAAFVMNQPITVGNNVDLASIKLDGRFGFDDYGNSVFVQPAGASGPTSPLGGVYLVNGFGAFTTLVTPAITGFAQGQNTIGFRLDGGQAKNDCAGGTCALGAIADFYVTAECTGEPPVVPPVNPTPVPALGAVGLGLLGLLSAGMGGLALRRRERTK